MSEQDIKLPLPPENYEAYRLCIASGQMPAPDIAWLYERDPAFLEYVRARR